MLAGYFNVASIKGDNRQLVREFLLGAVWAAVLTPLLFYLKFGRVDWFAIGFTVFLVVLCLLFALGFYFQTKTAYHTKVASSGGLVDRIGAFWLVACAFGPFFGWLITAPAFPLTENSWRWQYLARVFFAVVLPLLTAVPLIRYARGRAALIAVPVLIGITSLPILSCLWVLGDLHDGALVSKISISENNATGALTCGPIGERYDFPCAAVRTARAVGEFQVTWLPHTSRVVAVRKL